MWKMSQVCWYSQVIPLFFSIEREREQVCAFAACMHMWAQTVHDTSVVSEDSLLAFIFKSLVLRYRRKVI